MFHLTVSLIVAASTLLNGLQQAQPSGNTVAGVVVDPTGAVLPKAQIELKSPSAGQSRSTVTDETGAFQLDRVPPGRYDILVTFEGFQPTTVHLTVGARAPAPLRITMPLAGITQEVTVLTNETPSPP